MTTKNKNLFEAMVGKTVSFGLPNDTLALSVERIETFNDSLYFVGAIPSGATNNEWADTKTGVISLNSVSDFMIFEDEEDYRISMSKNDV